MIIDNSYFIDEIFIPHAKPSISDDVTSVSQDVTSFIEQYSEECLVKCLGYALFKEFSTELDPIKDNGLKEGSAEKWDHLLNGKEYTDSAGIEVHWKGIRFGSGIVRNKSFLADYVYYFYEKSEDDDRVGIGNVKQVGKNSTLVSKTPKVIAAWRRFFAAVQGESYSPTAYSMHISHLGVNGFGIDWMQQSNNVSLYKFITDSNMEAINTYDKFRPFYFSDANQYGL